MRNTMMPYNLQFFADGDGTGGDSSVPAANLETSTQNNGEKGEDDQTSSNSKEDSGEKKSFTQEDLTKIATTEKAQGKNSILKIFGVKDEKTAKEQAQAFKNWQDQQKTNEQKLKDQQTELVTANTRAVEAENKLSCIMSGVTKESISDALAIASLKVTEDKDLESVLKDMKTDARYKGFFSPSSTGTGSTAEHQSGTGSGNTENLGSRLAKTRATTGKKSSYFTN